MEPPTRTAPAPAPRDHAARGTRFLVVGVWNTAFGYAAFLAMLWGVERLGGHYLLATLPAHLVAVSQAFLMHRRFVFPDGERGLRAYLRYHLVYVGAFVVNLVLLTAQVELLGLSPELAQLLCIAVTVVLSYFGHFRFSFRVGAGKA